MARSGSLLQPNFFVQGVDAVWRKKQEITKIFCLRELQQSSSLPLFCSKHIQESKEHNKKSAKQCQSGRPTLKTYLRDKNISRNQKQHLSIGWEEKTFILWEQGCTDKQPSEFKTFPVFSQILYSSIVPPTTRTANKNNSHFLPQHHYRQMI